MKPLVILGAGGFARETLDIVDAINAVSPTWDMLGFIVDAQYGQPGTLVNDKPILGDFTWLDQHPEVMVVCGVGAPEIRRRMVLRAEQSGVQFATLLHPYGGITRWVTIGAGVILTRSCFITNQITIGDHVHINGLTSVGHDAVLENYVTIAPGVHVSGNVHIHEGAYVGTGVNILEKKTIGAWSIVGAGSTVVKDVPANTTVVGAPARVIKERPEGWHLNEN